MKEHTEPRVVECYDVPESPDPETVYRLLPKNPDQEYYLERTDRNIGWITREEQAMLQGKVIGIAACGGMGGPLPERFLRLGIGELRIGDPEVFDISNINRQLAARRSTIGKSKALETARMLRGISDDNCIVVYPQGICQEVVEHFVNGCDVICDEIEFWAVGARILLHQTARAAGIPVFSANTIGFGARLFFFTPTSVTMEESLGLTYDEAVYLQGRVQGGTATTEELVRLERCLVKGLLPELPEYCPDDPELSNVKLLHKRLLEEQKAIIITTNPPMATGFLADHVLLYLLRESSVKRDVVKPPEMPGYLYIDAAKMEAKVVKGRWW